MKKTYTCSFFGHRDSPAEIYQLIRKQIERLILEENTRLFYFRGYGRFGAMAARAANSLKKEYPFIKLICVMPYIERLETYDEYIENNFDGSLYPHGLEFVHRKYAISFRNRWIAVNSDFMIAYVKHEYGGAFQAMKMAANNGAHVFNIACTKYDMD